MITRIVSVATRRLRHLWLHCCTLAFFALQAKLVFAQTGYGDDLEEPQALEKILTSPFATLIIVLLGSTGIFNFFFASGRGERSDKQSLIALVCFLIVIVMVYYRCSVWLERRHPQ